MIKETQDMMELKVSKDQREIQDLLDQLVHRETKEIKDYRDLKETQV